MSQEASAPKNKSQAKTREKKKKSSTPQKQEFSHHIHFFPRKTEFMVTFSLTVFPKLSSMSLHRPGTSSYPQNLPSSTAKSSVRQAKRRARTLTFIFGISALFSKGQ